MSWWIFGKDDDHSELKDEIKQSFSAVKQDIKKAADWIGHLNTRDKHHEDTVEDMKERISTMESEMDEMKQVISFFSMRVNKQLFKQRQTADYKQTGVLGVQTGVQTGVQMSFLSSLSTMERAIIWVLLNTDMKLSCEDVAAILNKEKSTIRGQINAIKQKSEGMIEEAIEKNGKKRYFVADEVKDMLLSNMKAEKKTKKGPLSNRWKK
ncbi:MAG: hypothetical protein KJ879_00900 [Nanoarchaeota archaeon]|nr:hypothetical protein [Nanoarchaeota archaeon]